MRPRLRRSSITLASAVAVMATLLPSAHAQVRHVTRAHRSSATAVAGRWYSADSPFNQPIAAQPAVDPSSPRMVQTLVSGAAHGFVVSANSWTFPVYVASPSSARVTVSLTASWRGANFLRGVPVPAGATPDPAGDHHLTVLDPANGCEYDLFGAARNSDGSWSASWANSTYLSSDGIYDGGWAARASGFANGAGLIRPEELAAGVIPHALSFSFPFTKAGGPVWPATASDGRTTVAGAMPEGARLQLDPNLDLSAFGLTSWQKTIARALQRYGMFLADGGGTVALYAQQAASTTAAYPWGTTRYPMLPTTLLQHMRVLRLPPQGTPPAFRVPTACATLSW